MGWYDDVVVTLMIGQVIAALGHCFGLTWYVAADLTIALAVFPISFIAFKFLPHWFKNKILRCIVALCIGLTLLLLVLISCPLIHGVVAMLMPVSYEVYVPPNLDRSHKHPLLLAFSPAGSGSAAISVLKDACNRYQMIAVGSDNFVNETADFMFQPKVDTMISQVVGKYPIDRQHIYVTGVAAGGWNSYNETYLHSDFVRGVIVSSGITWFTHDNSPPPPDFPRNKLAVLLASPGNLRYEQMKKDRAILEGLGWKVKWIEFPGGLWYAPRATYINAMDWIAEQEHLKRN